MAKQPISSNEAQVIQAAFPGLPQFYVQHLLSEGWGETANGRMIYSEPIPANEIYGTGSNLEDVVLFGDDMGGYCLGFDLAAGKLVELDPEGEREAIDNEGFLKSY